MKINYREFISQVRFKIGYGEEEHILKKQGVFSHKEKCHWLQEGCIEQTEAGFNIICRDKDALVKVEMIEYENYTELIFKEVKGRVNRLVLTYLCEENEHFYGGGENFTTLDLKGHNHKIWVAEHQNARLIAEKFIKRKLFISRSHKSMLNQEKYDTYYAQPTIVSSRKYFIHADTDTYCEFDLRRRRVELRINEIPDKIIVGWGETFEKVLEKLTDILGRQPLLPQWVYSGSILGIQGGGDIVLNKLKEAKAAGTKVSALWCQDWQGIRITPFGKQLMWNWEYSEELYPKLPQFIEELKADGVRFLGYINPFIAIEGNLYNEASQKGYLVKNKVGEDYLVTITTFPAAMIDLTNPEASIWIKNIIKKNMIGIGLSGWMCDFGEYLPTDCVLYSGEDGNEIHNRWPALWAKVNAEAVQEAGAADEVFFFTRAGSTGTIRYSPMMWTGDQYVDFSYDFGMASSIVGSLSLTMSGFGLSHSDTGGYTTILDIKRSKETMLRWMEMNAFNIIYRGHEGNRPDENVQIDYDEEVISHYSRFSRVYEALSPYIKECVKENSERGVGAVRPLFMYYDENQAYTCQYEYLLGRDLLAAPVIDPGVEKWQVYLPKDNWIHLWTGEKYEGGNIEVPAPIGCPPVFYRESSSYKEIFEEVRLIK